MLATEAKLKKELETIARKAALAEGEEIFAAVKTIGGHHYLVAKMTAASLDFMRENVDRFKDKYRSGAILLGAVQGEKVNFVAGVTKDLTGNFKLGRWLAGSGHSRRRRRRPAGAGPGGREKRGATGRSAKGR